MSQRIQHAPSLLHKKTGQVKLSGIYRMYLGMRELQKIWIVDGEKVALQLFPDFIMGGNDQRYRFNPFGDMWIDNRIGIEELQYTIAHELIERKFMRERGWSYQRAHDEGGLTVESHMRERDARLVAKRGTPYRAYYGRRGGMSVWIVDGPLVRSGLNPDFCFATHDLKADFVPTGEIWLDSSMAIEEAVYSLKLQIIERKLLFDGRRFESAYDMAQATVQTERANRVADAMRHEAKLPKVNYGVRARGVKPR